MARGQAGRQAVRQAGRQTEGKAGRGDRQAVRWTGRQAGCQACVSSTPINRSVGLAKDTSFYTLT